MKTTKPKQHSAAQKVKVMDWVRAHKLGIMDERAAQATADLGFNVSASSIATWHHAIFGGVRPPRKEKQETTKSRLDKIEERLAKLESTTH